MRILIDISKDRYDEIMAMDWKNCRRFFDEEIRAIHDGKVQKIGQWIPVGYDGYADGYPVIDEWECSECGWEHSGDDDTLTCYCPNCGAKMEEAK